MKQTHYIIHYSEIAIKGKNRPWFERCLIENIIKALKGISYEKIKRHYGRIILHLKEDSNNEEIEFRLDKIFGISSFSPVVKVESDMDKIKECAWKLVKEEMEKGIKSVYVKTKRSDKRFPMKSPDVNRDVGKFLGEKANDLVVDFVNPELRVFIEIVENGSYLYIKKFKGLCGLPVGVSGRVMVLVSGGIDSPVASFLTLKRGCRNVYVHFHSEPYTKEASRKKVEELVSVIDKYQGGSKIYVVPFIDIQKEIMMNTDKKYRVVLYRRFMFRIAEAIARKEKCKALVTGENLAQVASQTLENMGVIQDVVSLPVVRPLVTYDKQEIIDLAKKIETYDISILPHDDCCSLFVPKHPVIKSEMKKVLEEEGKLDSDIRVKEALERVEKMTIIENRSI